MRELWARSQLQREALQRSGAHSREKRGSGKQSRTRSAFTQPKAHKILFFLPANLIFQLKERRSRLTREVGGALRNRLIIVQAVVRHDDIPDGRCS